MFSVSPTQDTSREREAGMWLRGRELALHIGGWETSCWHTHITKWDPQRCWCEPLVCPVLCVWASQRCVTRWYHSILAMVQGQEKKGELLKIKSKTGKVYFKTSKDRLERLYSSCLACDQPGLIFSTVWSPTDAWRNTKTSKISY